MTARGSCAVAARRKSYSGRSSETDSGSSCSRLFDVAAGEASSRRKFELARRFQISSPFCTYGSLRLKRDILRTNAECCSFSEIVMNMQSPYTTRAPNWQCPIVCRSCCEPPRSAARKCCAHASRFSNGVSPVAYGSFVVSPAIGTRWTPLPVKP